MKTRKLEALLPVAAAMVALAGCQATGAGDDVPSAAAAGRVLQPHYLEIVTPEVGATCSSLELSHGVTFGDPRPEFGGARTAPLVGGGMLGVRAPMHGAENSVVRPYLLVDDIDAAVANAVAAGAQLMMPPTPMPSGGQFSIYMLGGIEHGIWAMTPPADEAPNEP